MIARVPTYVRKSHGAVIAAIQREPGDELVTVRRSDRWQDGWKATIWRGQGMDADPVPVAVADGQPSPLLAFQVALERLRELAA